MEIWEPIQKAIDYIEQNIYAEISINELANNSYLSIFYFQRLFKRLIGKSTIEYVKLRKLDRAVTLIRKTREPISKIAYSLGFKNSETFTRVFSKVYGIKPSVFRAKKTPLIRFAVPDISATWSIGSFAQPLLADGIVFDIKKQSLSQPRYFDLSKTDNPCMDFADAEIEAPQITGAFYEPQNFFGWRLSVGSYVVCKVEVEKNENIPKICQSIIHFITNNWADKNKFKLDDNVGCICYKHNPDFNILELFFKIYEHCNADRYVQANNKKNNKRSEEIMYEPKMIIETVNITEDIKITGINFEKAGIEPKVENFGKMWDSFSDDCKNSIPNIKRPIVQYGISYPDCSDFITGREVTKFDDANGKYVHHTLPAGKYLKVHFNAQSFDELVCDRIFQAIELTRFWLDKNNICISPYHAEVYPSELTDKKYPEMYLMHLIIENDKINKDNTKESLFVRKNNVELVTINEDIKVVGLDFQKCRKTGSVKVNSPMELYSTEKFELQANIKNISLPQTGYGVWAHTDRNLILGKGVTEFEMQDEIYGTYTVPAGIYLKLSWNAETFSELVMEGMSLAWTRANVDAFLAEHNLVITRTLDIEVYPHQTMCVGCDNGPDWGTKFLNASLETPITQYPQMYKLFSIKEKTKK